MTIPKAISDTDDLWSVSDIAERFGKHRSTVWNWIRSGALKSEKYGDNENFHGVRDAELKRFLSIYKIPEKAKPTREKKKKRKNGGRR